MLVPWRWRRQDREARLSCAAQRTLEPMLEAAKVLRPAELHNVNSAQCPRVTAACAFDPEGRLEADKIGCCSNVPGRHSRPIC
jgi:hypothetical protein